MNYFKFGEGSKYFVIIPGISIKPISESKTAVCKQFSKYTDEYTFIVVDRYDELNPSCTVRSFAKSTKELLDSLNIKQAILYGTSQGGMIAEVMAIDYPELVEALVLCSSLPCANAQSLETFTTWKELASSYDTNKLNDHFLTMVYSPRYGKLLKELLISTNEKYSEEEFEKFHYSVDACLSFSCLDELDKIKCKTLVAYDVLDKVLGYEGSKIIIDKLKCDFVEFNRYGHAFYHESPVFLPKVFDFLKESK